MKLVLKNGEIVSVADDYKLSIDYNSRYSVATLNMHTPLTDCVANILHVDYRGCHHERAAYMTCVIAAIMIGWSGHNHILNLSPEYIKDWAIKHGLLTTCSGITRIVDIKDKANTYLNGGNHQPKIVIKAALSYYLTQHPHNDDTCLDKQAIPDSITLDDIFNEMQPVDFFTYLYRAAIHNKKSEPESGGFMYNLFKEFYNGNCNTTIDEKGDFIHV